MTMRAHHPLRPGTTCASTACRGGAQCGLALGIGLDALDRLMPMHVIVSMEGEILHAGPTIEKITGDAPLKGSAFFNRFDLRRPRGKASIEGLSKSLGRLRLCIRNEERTGLSAQVVELSCQRALLINLSLGISVVEGVRAFDLTSADFAETDLAVEMLFLVEAHASALSESKRLNNRLQTARLVAEQEAATDRLTGLRNRRAMEHVLARLIGQRTPFGLMHLDLDFFKEVNDKLGHAAGDAVLREVAARLKSCVREGDTVARVGGDEFIVLLHGVAKLQRLSDMADRLVAEVDRPVDLEDAPVSVSVSIGITATGLYDRPNAERMLQDADQALYTSKHNGRARFTVASPGDMDVPDEALPGPSPASDASGET